MLFLFASLVKSLSFSVMLVAPAADFLSQTTSPSNFTLSSLLFDNGHVRVMPVIVSLVVPSFARDHLSCRALKKTVGGFCVEEQLIVFPLPDIPWKIHWLIKPILALPSPASLPQSSGPFISTSEQDRWKVDSPSLVPAVVPANNS